MQKAETQRSPLSVFLLPAPERILRAQGIWFLAPAPPQSASLRRPRLLNFASYIASSARLMSSAMDRSL